MPDPDTSSNTNPDLSGEDCYYIGDKKTDIGDKKTDLKSEKDRDELRFRLRQYLDVRNVSILIGNGASLSLGSPSIGSVRSLQNELENSEYALQCADKQSLAWDLLNTLIPTESADIGLESLLGILAHLKADLECLRDAPIIAVRGKPITTDAVHNLEMLLKKWLYLRCAALSEKANSDKLNGHTELIRRFLLRPPTLPRLKVFTTNYDLMIELSLDALGIHYFDGFTGTIHRSLRSESYNYDLYFPGETTEGRVSRVDRVLQLYKMHGSVNWRRMSGVNY